MTGFPSFFIKQLACKPDSVPV